MDNVYPMRKMPSKRLVSLLNEVEVLDIIGDQDVLVEGVEFQSQLIQPNFVFVAGRGKFPMYLLNDHEVIAAAIGRGCTAVICETTPPDIDPSVTYVTVSNSHQALSIILKNFYENPSSKLKVVALTGTNGKTSTVTLSHWVFRQLGIKVGLMSTNCIRINDEEYTAILTTPGVVEVNQIMADMVAAGCEYCFIEATSHGLDQDRVGGIIMSGAVFTNISHDHIDYHGTFAAYLAAKKKLFDSLSCGTFALVNADDPNTPSMIKDTEAKIYYYSVKTEKDFSAKVSKSYLDGLELEIGGTRKKFNLVGEVNAYNILAAYGIAACLGKNKTAVLELLSRAPPIKGRFQCVPNSRRLLVVIDFAHTPKALEEVLKTANSFRGEHSKLVCVVGSGGDRDGGKRPVMAKIAADACDKVIITSDNPRFEAPQAIIDDMMRGVTSEEQGKVIEMVDRRLAIKQACEMARPGDVVLIAGKGHEAYQIIGDKYFSFDDFEIAKELVKE